MKKSQISFLTEKTEIFDVKPPSHLPKSSHALFRLICRHLHEIGNYHESDHGLVVEYCLTAAEAEMCRKIYMQEGLMVHAAHGDKSHPMIASANQCRATMIRIATALGLTPVTRKKLGAAAASADESGWAEAA